VSTPLDSFDDGFVVVPGGTQNERQSPPHLMIGQAPMGNGASTQTDGTVAGINSNGLAGRDGPDGRMECDGVASV